MRSLFLLSIMAVSCARVATPLASDLAAIPAGKVPLLMSANVEMAFDGIEDGTEYEDYSLKSSDWSPAHAQAKAQRVSEVIKAAHCPKIVVATEVENQRAADLIAQASGCGYKAISANQDQSQTFGVAIFTVLPIKGSRLIKSGYRPHLRVDLEGGLSVIGVHFKSMRDGGEEKRRMAADAVQRDIQANPAARVMVAGDFNTDEDILGKSGLKNCTIQLPGTHCYQGQWNRLDKIYSTSCGVVARMDEDFLMRNGVPYRTALYKKNGETCHLDRGYSDHLPLLMYE